MQNITLGELHPPTFCYTQREESALQALGNILRVHPTMTVAECEDNYNRAVCSLHKTGTIILEIIERDRRVAELRRLIEAGAYEVDGERVAERMLTYPQMRDVERRRDYLEKRDGEMPYEEPSEDSVFSDAIFRSLLYILILLGAGLVAGAAINALRLL